jgi:Putative restriction endonuclease
MGAMTTPVFWSGQDRVLTVEDMEDMPDDEFRYELDDGVLIVSPAPSHLHQLAVARLTVILPRPAPGFMTGAGRRTFTRASASPRTGSSSRTGIVPS